MWKYSQDWSVTDGVAYMRFALDGSSSGGIKPVSSDGTVGLIVRQDGGWTKDGSDDRIWNIEKSNKEITRQTDMVVDYDYKFNMVTDSDIVKPDTTGYITNE